MYEAFYELRERPFDLTPNPRFLYMTAGHREALTAMEYGISARKGVTLLTGPAGTGKTTLVQVAVARAQGQNSSVLCVKNPTLTREEFYEFLANGFGLSEAAGRSKTRLLQELETRLVQQHGSGTVTALMVDEAQSMSDALLEEVRLLANMETATEKLLPVVLVGQPELAARLNEAPLQQLRQRVAVRTRLSPLSADETADYIAERIRVAGGDIRRIFTPEAIVAIYRCSSGIPRTISVVCDNALVSGFALDQAPIGRGVIHEVARDFELPLPGIERALPALASPPARVPATPFNGKAAAAPRPQPPPVPPPPAIEPAPPPASAGSLIVARAPFRGTPSRLTLGLRAAPEEAAPAAAAAVAVEAPPKRKFRSLFARTAQQ